MMDSLGYPDEPLSRESKYLDADAGAKRGWVGLAACLLFLLAAAAVALGVFVRYTRSYRLAMALVAFVLTYVLVIGYLASKNGKK